jgi:1-acyl-sn-glycerol-3-phosphate acyltransferase
MKTAVGRFVVRALRYRIEGGPPPTDPVCVLVGAPHTSWLDFPLMLGIAWANGLSPHFLAKREMFRPPFGAVMRALGGLPVDRENPGTLVADLVERASAGQPLALVVAPEGTRGRGDTWKSGFYRIAEAADVPIALTYLDGPTRTGGFGPSLRPSGDVRADMDVVRAFYAGKRGVRPERRTEPVLREEASDSP